jgi:hypothetical protein
MSLVHDLSNNFILHLVAGICAPKGNCSLSVSFSYVSQIYADGLSWKSLSYAMRILVIQEGHL